MKRLVIICLMLCAISAFGQAANPGLLAWLGTQDTGGWICPTNGLVADWSFDGDAIDTIGNVTGTVYGAVLTNGAGGIANTAYYFDGTDDRIDVDDVVDTIENDQQGAISFWSRPSDFTVRRAFSLMQYNIALNWSFICQLCLYNDNPVHRIIFQTSAATSWSPSAATNAVDEWIHVLFQSNGSTTEIWYNGVKRLVNKDGALADGFWIADLGQRPDYFTFGCLRSTGVSKFYKGRLDAFRIYNQAQTTNDIITLSQEFD